MMLDTLKDVLLAGVGGTALSIEKADEVIKNLVEKGKLSVEEGKNLSGELIQKAKDSTPSMNRLNKEELQAALIELNVAQQQDIASLESQIQTLRSEVNSIKDELAK